jgi:hypothetical protein
MNSLYLEECTLLFVQRGTPLTQSLSKQGGKSVLSSRPLPARWILSFEQLPCHPKEDLNKYRYFSSFQAGSISLSPFPMQKEEQCSKDYVVDNKT